MTICKKSLIQLFRLHIISKCCVQLCNIGKHKILVYRYAGKFSHAVIFYGITDCLFVHAQCLNCISIKLCYSCIHVCHELHIKPVTSYTISVFILLYSLLCRFEPACPQKLQYIESGIYLIILIPAKISAGKTCAYSKSLKHHPHNMDITDVLPFFKAIIYIQVAQTLADSLRRYSLPVTLICCHFSYITVCQIKSFPSPAPVYPVTALYIFILCVFWRSPAILQAVKYIPIYQFTSKIPQTMSYFLHNILNTI